MRGTLVAVLLTALAWGCLPWSGITRAQADSCGQLSWSVGHEIDLFADGFLPTVESALSLPKEGVFALLLKPASDVVYPVTPERGRDGSYGGFVTLERIPAGRYQIILSEEAWVDAVQEGARLPVLAFSRSSECPGVRQSVQFDVAGEPLILQIGGVNVPRVNIAVIRIWPWPVR
jgi:hypothetical protein